MEDEIRASYEGKKISYFFNPEIGKYVVTLASIELMYYDVWRYYYSKDHPMKPKRVAMAHSLIQNFGLYKDLDVYSAREATFEEMLKFHDQDYLQYL